MITSSDEAHSSNSYTWNFFLFRVKRFDTAVFHHLKLKCLSIYGLKIKVFHINLKMPCFVVKTRAGHTRQYWRDNETMFPGHKVVCYCNITIFGCGYSIYCRHQDLNIFRKLSSPWGSITLSHCRCHEAIKLSRAQLW